MLLGRGDGTFLPATLYPNIGTQPTMVAIADLNGDRTSTCHAYGAPSSDVTVLLGKGAARSDPNERRNGGIADDAELAELNGDGVPDIVNENLGTSFDLAHPEIKGSWYDSVLATEHPEPKQRVQPRSDWPMSALKPPT